MEEITRAVRHAGDGTESRGGRSRASYRQNLIILAYPRVTLLLSCAFEHFTRHLRRSAVGRSDQRSTNRMKRRVRRRCTVCSLARRFPLTLRVASDYMYLAVCVSRVPTRCRLFHSRAHAMLRAIRSRSEAFSSLPESSR